MKGLLKAATGCSLALALTACSHGIQIAEHSIDYNKSVETAENAMLFLNIIRSAQSRPMHFTRISAVQSTLSSSLDLAPALPLGSNSTENYGNGLAVSVSSSPTVTYAILNSKEFYNGILTPVSDQIFDLFRSQGWPLDRLMHVLVERVELFEAISTPDGQTERGNRLCVVNNDPHRLEDIEAFEAIISYAGKAVERAAAPEGTAFGPALAKGDIASADALKKLRDTGLELKQVRDPTTKALRNEFQLRTPSEQKRYKMRTVTVPADAVASVKRNVADSEEPLALKCGPTDIDLLVGGATELGKARQRTQREPDPKTVAKVEADVYLRSVQAMLYYLGQLTWVDITDPETGEYDPAAAVLGANRNWSVSRNAPGAAAVSVEYGGQTFSIAADQYRTLSYLTLVRQLFALNVAAEQTPAGPTILQVVGN
ncbi:MAG: hypothetical protein AAGD13_08980 [Pseudomonadota bacterium]